MYLPLSFSLFLSLSCSLFVLSLSLSFFGYLLNGAGFPAYFFLSLAAVSLLNLCSSLLGFADPKLTWGLTRFVDMPPVRMSAWCLNVRWKMWVCHCHLWTPITMIHRKQWRTGYRVHLRCFILKHVWHQQKHHSFAISRVSCIPISYQRGLGINTVQQCLPHQLQENRIPVAEEDPAIEAIEARAPRSSIGTARAPDWVSARCLLVGFRWVLLDSSGSQEPPPPNNPQHPKIIGKALHLFSKSLM